ncbi:uncharacterized protein ASPGLDRAFT_545180 [Aspergillus glaucus CBS 516.65]|uniref:Uncharacterized protein n=1 Tax=Aspergillus glaucus CBS 516.65 TaxID=1160497 RepID=A0A1L9VEV0_ASPGL|nr:hypothetical protein ASPGLDRAFT_545180 [Aspergillus glaucus CBS 516.65]OJJ82457.1 hypothetical protein ASPGLDRAFT_545180 [Aspergillus glaucus CBS 516.65]
MCRYMASPFFMFYLLVHLLIVIVHFWSTRRKHSFIPILYPCLNPCVFCDIFIMKAPYPIFASLFTHRLSFISSHLCHQTGACAGLDVPCPDKNLYIYILSFLIIYMVWLRLVHAFL